MDAKIKEAIEEIRRRAPVRINDAPNVELQNKDLTAKSRFEDDHEFVIALPAWVFRAFRNNNDLC